MARLAKSLEILRDNVNAAAPHRNRQSDGWIGDARHAKGKSDHNPNPAGVVLALDITHDPRHGVDCEILAQSLIADPRTKYVIWNKQIYNTAYGAHWRPYNKKNPHTKHVHISVRPEKEHYDRTKPWDIKITGGLQAPKETPEFPLLKPGDQNEDVMRLQELLMIPVDGDYGPMTEKMVRHTQKKAGIVVDGICGPYTWLALDRARKQ